VYGSLEVYTALGAISLNILNLVSLDDYKTFLLRIASSHSVGLFKIEIIFSAITSI
jgi:hypothetical protein